MAVGQASKLRPDRHNNHPQEVVAMASLAGTPHTIPHWQPTIGILPNGAVGVQSERHPGRYWTVRSTPTGGTCTLP